MTEATPNERRHGDALRDAGVQPMNPWAFLAARRPPVRITQPIAQALSDATGMTEQFWLNMQEAYDG